MAMRLSGLMSGMDTESIVSQLVEAKKVKVDTKKKEQTKLEWKQDAWKELNTKLKNLQSKYINNMRFSTAFAKKTTKVSDSSAVSVITGDDAVNGVQYLKVDSLAKTGYLTGGVISATDDEGNSAQATALARMSDLGFSGTGSFDVKIGGTKKGSVNVTESTTISDVLNQLKGYGLNASFDVSNQRLFISSKSTGEAADFELTASDADGKNALAKLGLQTTDYYSKFAYKTDANGNKIALTVDDYADDIAQTVSNRLDAYATKYNNILTKQKEYSDLKTELSGRSEYADIVALVDELDGTTAADDERKTEVQTQIAEKITALQDSLNDDSLDEDAKTALKEDIQKLSSLRTQALNQENLATQKTALEADVDFTDADNDGVYEAVENSSKKDITAEVTQEYQDRLDEAVRLSASDTAGATKIDGSDAVVYLNGAKFTSTSNVFNINGLTITANHTTDSAVTLTTERDTDGIYDMVKNFLKEYNGVINEIDKLYNAASAKDYEPLTDEEKEAMSETEIEKYEQKIKDSLLRRDENLNTIGSALRQIMSSGFTAGGKTMYLFDFGISTLGYFNAAENEKNAYHIDGDADDADTSGNTDKLRAMIASNPDTVVDFFTAMSKSLYDKMTSLSASANGYRSFGSFYDDKKMKTDYDDYTTKIKEMEEKLNDYEDKWYKKFSKMETAMAKMQQNSNAIASMLGGGNS